MAAACICFSSAREYSGESASKTIGWFFASWISAISCFFADKLLVFGLNWCCLASAFSLPKQM